MAKTAKTAKTTLLKLMEIEVSTIFKNISFSPKTQKITIEKEYHK